MPTFTSTAGLRLEDAKARARARLRCRSPHDMGCSDCDAVLAEVIVAAQEVQRERDAALAKLHRVGPSMAKALRVGDLKSYNAACEHVAAALRNGETGPVGRIGKPSQPE